MAAAALALGAARPARTQVLGAVVSGVVLMGVSNGLVGVASRMIPSSLAALLVGVTPLWLVLLDRRWFGGPRPSGRVVLGIAIGLAGLALLGGVAASSVDRHASAGLLLVFAAGGTWAWGSLLARHRPHPRSMPLTAGLQLFAGGVAQLLLALITGEWVHLDVASISARSLWAVLYLVVVGSWVGFLSYLVVVRRAPVALGSTYAYVNPVVAVFAGWAFAGEPVTARMLLAAAVLLTGVAVVASDVRR
jgi:drug/metabolite transporter (DMT)-like permease